MVFVLETIPEPRFSISINQNVFNHLLGWRLKTTVSRNLAVILNIGFGFWIFGFLGASLRTWRERRWKNQSRDPRGAVNPSRLSGHVAGRSCASLARKAGEQGMALHGHALSREPTQARAQFRSLKAVSTAFFLQLTNPSADSDSGRNANGKMDVIFYSSNFEQAGARSFSDPMAQVSIQAFFNIRSNSAGILLGMPGYVSQNFQKCSVGHSFPPSHITAHLRDLRKKFGWLKPGW